jgi:hypothetical protein
MEVIIAGREATCVSENDRDGAGTTLWATACPGDLAGPWQT